MLRPATEQVSGSLSSAEDAPPTALDEAVARALGKATALHEEGQHDEAEQLYRAILKAQPRHAVANHGLGLLEVQRQQPAAGLPHFLAALEASPETSAYWLSYIEALRQAGQEQMARQALALGRQHGLTGEAVESLARQLADSPASGQGPRAGKPKPCRKTAGKVARARHAAPDREERSTLVALFEAGHYADGERLARALTERFPNDGFSWKALGALLKAQGRDAEALVAMRQAARLLPRDEQVQSNLGLALAGLGEMVEAEACHRNALRLRRDFAEGHYNLGNVLLALRRHKEAATSFRRAVALQPGFSLAHNNLGSALIELGQLTDAEVCLQRAVALQPNLAEAHNNLGNALIKLDRLQEAEASYQRALALQPDLVEAHNNLGRSLAAQSRFEEAETSYRRALALKPDYAEACDNLAQALIRLDRPAEAEQAWRLAVLHRPDFAEAHDNLANHLNNQNRLADAEAAWRAALSCKPDFVAALLALSSLLRTQGRYDEAEEHLRRALEHESSPAIVHFNLGNLFHVQDRLSEAEASFRTAIVLDPTLFSAHLNLGVILTALGRYAEGEAACRQALALKADSAVAFSNMLYGHSHNEAIDAPTLFAEHCRFGEQFEVPLRANWTAHGNTRDPERCLQVGFVSADFRNHAVANFIEPVLAELAGNPRLSLHAYYNHSIEDHVSQRLRPRFAHWHPVATLSDDGLAEQVRADQIDILIDLSGHSAQHRLLTFARKPAPIQASWMGYPGTTGLQSIDYYFADRFFLPPGEFDDQFTEKIVCLPANAPFLPFAHAPAVSALPALSEGRITFGSFNRPTKINPSVVALWAQLLLAVPDSRMLLGAMRPDARSDELIAEFARHGVDRERLILRPRCGMVTYLALHQEVDICLDTFPYTGGTTTLHACWMGVPTLTLAGPTIPGRPGACVLGHLGLPTFLATTPAEFVDRGVAAAADPDSLAKLRDELRERLRQSAVGQPRLVAVGLERALRLMWRRWCEQLSPEAFAVLAEDLDVPPPAPRAGQK